MENEELEKETRNLIPDEEKAKADYNANDIQVLEGLEKDQVCILVLLLVLVYIIVFGKL